MNGWTAILNVVLGAAALACLLWGLRQRALLRRVHAGLLALRSRQFEHRVGGGADDNEPILGAFDQLAFELEADAATREPQSNVTNLQSVLGKLCEALRQPLLAIQMHVDQIGKDALQSSDVASERMRLLRQQVGGLLRLLETSQDISDLQRGLSGLRREQPAAAVTVSAPAILILDEIGAASDRIQAVLTAQNWTSYVAPGLDAARVMARALAPSVLLVHARNPKGLGWRALAELDRHAMLVTSTVWLLGYESDQQTGQFWTPSGVWFWPTVAEEKRLTAWRDKLPHVQLAISGDGALSGQIVDRLAQIGTHVLIGGGAHVPVFDGCATLALVRESGAPASTSDYVLVVPAETAVNHPQELALACDRQADRWTMDWGRLIEQLVQRLETVIRPRLQPDGRTR